MTSIHRSSSGCHVAHGDVAPGNPVSNETERSTLTINEQRHCRCHLVATSPIATWRLACSRSIDAAGACCWWSSPFVIGW
jgi:hypothetical protein